MTTHYHENMSLRINLVLFLTSCTIATTLIGCGDNTTTTTDFGYLRPRDWRTTADMLTAISVITGGCATHTNVEGITNCTAGEHQTYIFTIDPADIDTMTTQPLAGKISMIARAQSQERDVAAAVLIGPRWQIACYGSHALSNCTTLREAFHMKTMDVYNIDRADNADDFRYDVTVRIQD